MRNKIYTLIATLVAVFTCLTFVQSLFAEDLDREGVIGAQRQFYVALNQLFIGDDEPMLEVWSHADDVNYMGPTGGLEVGWKQVSNVWETQAKLKLGGKIEPTKEKLVIGSDIAVVSNYEEGVNTNVKGAISKVSIRATNVFRKENGRWKMIGHHTDLLPELLN